MVMAVGVAIGDELVPFPFWQHGAGVTTFWSISHTGTSYPIVTISLYKADGSFVQATTSTVNPGTAWMPDTAKWGQWYTMGMSSGFGYYEIASTEDTVYLWGCVYGILTGQGQTGFTIVMPQNPYGL